jgi:hypothetical protein
MPLLQLRAKGVRDQKAKDDQEKVAKDDQEKDAKDDQEKDAKDDQEKIVMTKERKTLATKIEAAQMNAPSETRKQGANGPITKKPTGIQPRTKSTEKGKKIETIRKDLGTGTEINLVNDQTKKIPGKIGDPITEKTKRCRKRRVSVVFFPNFSVNRLPSKIVKQRVQAQSGSL